MPDDTGDKTEPATPRRKTEARERGQIAKSPDLTSALLLLGGMICVKVFMPRTMAALMKVLKDNLLLREPGDAANTDLVTIVSSIGMIALAATGPILLSLFLLALLANLYQVGLLFTLHPLQPKLEKLNPINGFKRIFSAKTFVQLAMNLVKLSLVCTVGYSVINDRKDDLMLAMAVGGWRQVLLISDVLFDVGIRLAVVLLFLALLDYAWQKYKHEKDMRMSKQEVKEELRRMEGDPIIRQRRRRMQFAAAIQRIRSAVPTADVVVTNPTELAIAIKYDSKTMRAPKVVAKGQNLLAGIIRDVAARHGIPIIERPPLAQALFKMVEVGQEVPERFYKVIAEVLAYVYELTGKSPRPAAASAA